MTEKLNVNVKIPEAMYARLVNEADATGCTLSELVTKRLGSEGVDLARALADALRDLVTCLAEGGNGEGWNLNDFIEKAERALAESAAALKEDQQ